MGFKCHLPFPLPLEEDSKLAILAVDSRSMLLKLSEACIKIHSKVDSSKAILTVDMEATI